MGSWQWRLENLGLCALGRPGIQQHFMTWAILSSICLKNFRFMLTFCRVYGECVWIDWQHQSDSHLNNFYCMFESHEITIVISAAQCSTIHQPVSIAGCQEKWERHWSSTTLREKWDKTLFVLQRTQEWLGILLEKKTECAMGLGKGMMINEKPQITCNHRKIGLEWTLIRHVVHPPIPMPDQ